MARLTVDPLARYRPTNRHPYEIGQESRFVDYGGLGKCGWCQHEWAGHAKSVEDHIAVRACSGCDCICVPDFGRVIR